MKVKIGGCMKLDRLIRGILVCGVASILYLIVIVSNENEKNILKAEVKTIATSESEATLKMLDEKIVSEKLSTIYNTEAQKVKPIAAMQRHLIRQSAYYGCKANGGSTNECIGKVMEQYASEEIPHEILASKKEIEQENKDISTKYASLENQEKQRKWQVKYYEILAQQ